VGGRLCSADSFAGIAVSLLSRRPSRRLIAHVHSRDVMIVAHDFRLSVSDLQVGFDHCRLRGPTVYTRAVWSALFAKCYLTSETDLLMTSSPH